MRKFAHNQRTDKKRRNSNTETTLSLSSVDTRGSWPTDDKNEIATTKTEKDKIKGKTIREADIRSILNFLQTTTILTLKLKMILKKCSETAIFIIQLY